MTGQIDKYLLNRDLPLRTIGPENPAHPFHSEYLISTNGYVAERIWSEDIPQDVIKALTGLCRRHKTEQCGFITKAWEIVAVDNAHGEPTHNFYMDIKHGQKELDRIYDELHSDVLAVWHTHPNNWPWPTPRDICGWPDQSVVDWRYFVVNGSDVTEWRKVRAT